MLSNSYAFITDIFGEDNYSQNPSFIISSYGGSFTTTSSLNLGNDGSISVSLHSGLVVSTTTSSFTNPGKINYYEFLISKTLFYNMVYVIFA